jgi:hypothetical protein
VIINVLHFSSKIAISIRSVSQHNWPFCCTRLPIILVGIKTSLLLSA